MRIALLSDLHAFNSRTWDHDSSPSHFDIAGVKSDLHCPMKSLTRLVQSDALTADYLLCPGDLTNNACAESLPKAWQTLHDIGKELKARQVLATVGNHDVDSRRLHNSYDPIEALKSLSPSFPINDRALSNQFWSEHFCIYTDACIRCLIVNSSAYHATPDEIKNGRIAERTISLIRQALDGADSSRVNLLLCHHHPQKHSELHLGEYDEIKGGQLLLDLIAEPQRGNWLAIHGHKHHPKITYASGGSSSPVVFSAGSVASTLYPELTVATGNQFYLITIDPVNLPVRGLVGTFRSWDWHPGFGWQPAEAGKGLPAIGGFGSRENPIVLSHRIAGALHAYCSGYLRGRDIVTRFPEVEFLTPLDLRALECALEALSIACTFTPEGQLDEVCSI